MGADFPSRIVCLSAEAVEVLYLLGCGDRIAGVTGFAAEPPEARKKPRVSGFSSVDYEKIDALEPELVITFSDVQAAAAQELIRRGHTVLATNQRSIGEIFETILLISRIVHRESEALLLIERMRGEIKEIVPSSKRPRVYFEEWDEPMISGICWVSELIEAAGGEDIFAEFRERKSARERVVTSKEVIERQPDIIIASWCGKKADLNAIRDRPGWSAIPAVRYGHVYEIDSAYILQPGPGVLKGLRQMREIVMQTRAV